MLLVLLINVVRFLALFSNIIVLVNRHYSVLFRLHPHMRIVLGLVPRKWRLQGRIGWVDVTKFCRLFPTVDVRLELLGNLLELLVDVPGRNGAMIKRIRYLLTWSLTGLYLAQVATLAIGVPVVAVSISLRTSYDCYCITCQFHKDLKPNFTHFMSYYAA